MEKLWTTIYLERGHYATLDPATLKWELTADNAHYDVIKNVAEGMVGQTDCVSRTTNCGSAACMVSRSEQSTARHGKSDRCSRASNETDQASHTRVLPCDGKALRFNASGS